MTNRRKSQLCLEWLCYCRSIGWSPNDLVTLNKLFWLREWWQTFKGYPR